VEVSGSNLGQVTSATLDIINWRITDTTKETPITLTRRYTRVNVSGLASWSENCKWYSSLPLDVVVSLFCESVS
jgi:hypothetical protein